MTSKANFSSPNANFSVTSYTEYVRETQSLAHYQSKGIKLGLF